MSFAAPLTVVGLPTTFDAVVVGLHLRWDGVYQRPQHVLTRVAKHVPVFIIEEPLYDDSDLLETIVDGNVTIFRPHFTTQQADILAERTIHGMQAATGFRNPLVWLYTPMMIELLRAYSAAPLVFDAMDELANFAHPDARIRDREHAVLERAALVFCGGPSLYRSRAGRSRNVRQYSSGVDIEFFERARTIAPHHALAAIAKPIFGYVGVIDERVDLALIAAIADARPDASIILVGPVAKIDSSSLPIRPNIHYLGKQRYDDLPALLAGFDVALMPFALNESTQFISPTKTLEYLAAGKPVVSTAVPDVVSEYTNIVTIAHDQQAFIDGLQPNVAEREARLRAADRCTHAAGWNAIVANMLADLAHIGITPEGKDRARLSDHALT